VAGSWKASTALPHAAVAAALKFSCCSTERERSLNLSARSNFALVIQPGATLVAWPDPDTYNATTRSVFPLVYASSAMPATNVSVTGGGTIDGQGWRWWPFLKTRPRPCLVEMGAVSGLLLANVTLRDSPTWNTILRGSAMRVVDVTVVSNAGVCGNWTAAPNTDGINIGGQDIHVSDSFIHNGDDCVPVNSPGNASLDTTAVLVERVHCECGTNGGVPIMAGNNSIHNVTFRDMSVAATNQGAGVKISEAYDFPHGTVHDVTWANITITLPRNAAVYANVFEEDAGNCARQPTPNNGPGWLKLSNLAFVNITATLPPGVPSGCFLCSADTPCSLAFDNVVATANGTGQPADAYVCKNANVTGGSGGSSPAPCGA
jgi:hypothetical protein